MHLQEVPEPKSVPNRMHFDLVVSGEGPSEARWQRVTDEVARLRAAGASVRKEFPGRHVVMADPRATSSSLDLVAHVRHCLCQLVYCASAAEVKSSSR